MSHSKSSRKQNVNKHSKPKEHMYGTRIQARASDKHCNPNFCWLLAVCLANAKQIFSTFLFFQFLPSFIYVIAALPKCKRNSSRMSWALWFVARAKDWLLCANAKLGSISPIAFTEFSHEMKTSTSHQLLSHCISFGKQQTKNRM